MPLNENELNELAVQESRFFAGVAQIVEGTFGFFLYNPLFPDYGSANRVLALRDDGRGADATAEAVLTFFQKYGIRPTADLDIVAESQGIGSALRRRGLNAAVANRLLMRYDSETLPEISSVFSIERVSNETGSDETRAWLDISVSDEQNAEDAAEWREILRCDAREISHELYITYCDDVPASCCQLFADSGYGRIDDVMTRREYRGRGLASAVVAHTVRRSIGMGNQTTFLYCEAGSAAEKLYRKLGFSLWERNPFRRHFVPSP